MFEQPQISPGVRVLLIAACLIVVVAGLRLAAGILVPLAAAVFIAIISLPALTWFRRREIPPGVAILVIFLLNAAILSFLGWIVVRSATEMTAALPYYLERFYEIEASLIGMLQGWGIQIAAVPYADLVQPERVFGLVTSVLLGAAGAVSTALLVLLFLIFMLTEAAGLPGKMRAAFGESAGDLARFAPIVEQVQQYLALKTLISLATGMLIGLAALLLGVDFPLFWGLLAFLLNYIPNIGSILAAIPAVAVAMLQLGLWPALAFAAAFIAVNVVLGGILEPAMMGRRLGLSTLVVILSLVFWGWVWGLIGMILSLPLTMTAKIAMENTRDLRWVAVLLGPGPVERPRGAGLLRRSAPVQDPSEVPRG